MKTITSALMIALLALSAGCGGGDDGGTTPPPPPSDQTVLDRGWAAYEGADMAEAESQFRALLGRGTLPVEAHDGLGWAFSATGSADSAVAHFGAAVAAGADTTAIADQVFAGQCFALAAGGEHDAALWAAGEVTPGWEFAHDPGLDSDDLYLTVAICHYALGEWYDCLLVIQMLDPTFTANSETAEGRAAMAAKIEELRG